MKLSFFDNLLHSLSWVFIHSLWQGLVLALLAAAVMLLTKHASARLRYLLLCSLFACFIGSVLITFLIEWNEVAPAAAMGASLSISSPFFDSNPLKGFIDQVKQTLDLNTFYIVLGWSIILAFRMVRMVSELLYVSRLKKQGILQAPDNWQQTVDSFAASLGINRKIPLFESAILKIPVVVGHLKPMILLPLGALTRLSAAEVEAVLIHELAHIRRHDFLVNLIQRITTMLFFFNPGIIWISSLIKIEREHCCDDIAIGHTNDRLRFVQALISFKEHSLREHGYVLALTGKKSLLLQRMIRIVHRRNRTLSGLESVVLCVNLVACLFLATMLGGRNLYNNRVLSAASLARDINPPLFQAGPRNSSILLETRSIVVKLSEADHYNNLPAQRESTPVSMIDEHTEEPQAHQPTSVVQHLTEPMQYKEIAVGTDEERDWSIRRKQAEDDRRQADLDRIDADRDREQAEVDRRQADKDREQADRDRKQAEIDRQLAAQYRLQADKDRLQADIERKRAEKERQAAIEKNARSQIVTPL